MPPDEARQSRFRRSRIFPKLLGASLEVTGRHAAALRVDPLNKLAPISRFLTLSKNPIDPLGFMCEPSGYGDARGNGFAVNVVGVTLGSRRRPRIEPCGR